MMAGQMAFSLRVRYESAREDLRHAREYAMAQAALGARKGGVDRPVVDRAARTGAAIGPIYDKS